MKKLLFSISVLLSLSAIAQVTRVYGTNSTGISWSILNPTTTPHLSLTLTPSAVGLANVNNTQDANKPVSTPQQTALNLKSDKTTVNTLQTGLLDSISRLKTTIATLASQVAALTSSMPQAYKDTIDQLQASIATLTTQQQTLSNNFSVLPSLNYKYFEGDGGSIYPILNKPLNVTQAQRTSLQSPIRPGLIVYQTDGVTGWYGYKSDGWHLLTIN